MKRVLCLLLCAAFAAFALAACGENESSAPEEGQLFTVRDELKRDSVTALFKSTSSDETKEIELKKGEETDDHTVFTCNADPEVFDRVILTSGDDSTPELSFNKYVPGWKLDKRRFMPLDGDLDQPQYKRVSFPYENRTKDVLIWTPDDYDPKASEKYPVIYMSDGQNLFDPAATSTGSWAVAESVRAMKAQGGPSCVIVGVENMDGWRDNELTPDIGDVTSEDYKDGHGEYYSDFVVNTVMPYVNENYNVYTDREHTHVCGSSSGGIECFYIAMEHPDKFASVGAFSPAFILFDDDAWLNFFKDKDYSKNAPLVYLYCGNATADSLEQTLHAGTISMPDILKEISYPGDKVVMKLYKDGLHNEMYWRAVFPDYLKYAFK